MGAINNAFNQAAGAAAGAALAIKHAKETDFSKAITAENAAIVARNQSREADAESNAANDEAHKEGGLVEQLSVAEVNREEAEKEYNKAVNRKNGSPLKRLEKFTELEAAKKAEYELKNKYKALVDINNRAEEQRQYAAKASQIASKAQQRYQSNWGGNK